MLIKEIRLNGEFEDWRQKARVLLNHETHPSKIVFTLSEDFQDSLAGIFSHTDTLELTSAQGHPHSYNVPQSFLSQAKIISAHRDSSRWILLYSVLWRLTHGEHELMTVSIDPEVEKLNSMYRSVRRDMHKMTAFVRFREVKTLDFENKPESWFVAWYEPDHRIVKLTAQFFLKRFNGMNFSILTPDESLHWNRKQSTFGPGSHRSQAPSQDEIENLWKTYYASIFNPARIKERAMKKEMAVRYWKNLPETELISTLIRQAPARLQEFYNFQTPGADQWLPTPESRTLESLRTAVQNCRACEICKTATQAVFGEGPMKASIVLVGEQPGDQEDLIGRPFVGPAGALLNQAFILSGIDRNKIYLTNAVKHFKWIPNGKIRLHQRPSSAEIAACKPWLSAEIKLLKPQVLICLGVSAAQSIFGKSVTLGQVRGRVFSTPACEQTWITTHPSALLRETDPEKQAIDFRNFVEDLKRSVLSNFNKTDRLHQV